MAKDDVALKWLDEIRQNKSIDGYLTDKGKPNFFTLGIDPGGVSCGAAIIDPCGKRHAPKVTCLDSFQEHRTSTSRGKVRVVSYNYVDTCSLATFIEPILSSDINCVAFVEDVHTMPTDSKVSAFNFGRNFGAILGLLKYLNIPVIRIAPVSWKKYYWPKGSGTTKLEKKDASIDRAIELFPQVGVSVTKKKDHNQAEALLIANYGRVKLSDILTREVVHE